MTWKSTWNLFVRCLTNSNSIKLQNHEGSKESKDVQNEFGYATKNLNKNSREEYLMRNTYSKLSIIKPGPSRLLEFEKK